MFYFWLNSCRWFFWIYRFYRNRSPWFYYKDFKKSQVGIHSFLWTLQKEHFTFLLFSRFQEDQNWRNRMWYSIKNLWHDFLRTVIRTLHCINSSTKKCCLFSRLWFKYLNGKWLNWRISFSDWTLKPNNDQHQFSPCNIDAEQSGQKNSRHDHSRWILLIF